VKRLQVRGFDANERTEFADQKMRLLAFEAFVNAEK
jgi:hypothetical protein